MEDARSFGPVAQQDRLTYPATTVEQHQLGRAGACPFQDRIEEGQFDLAIYEHPIAFLAACWRKTSEVSDIIFATTVTSIIWAIPRQNHFLKLPKSGKIRLSEDCQVAKIPIVLIIIERWLKHKMLADHPPRQLITRRGVITISGRPSSGMASYCGYLPCSSPTPVAYTAPSVTISARPRT